MEKLKRIIKTGLYFGSFNPIHIGHLAIANYMIEFTGLEQLWFVVSPHNPLKEKRSLLKDYHRLEMVRLAVEDDDRLGVSDIEFKLPTPSFTIDTLAYLEEKNPGREFQLVMGADGIRTFHKWKHADLIAQKYHRLIYPRTGSDMEALARTPNATVVNAPLIEISSSFIRRAIREGKDIRHLVPAKVYTYMREMHFYEK
jgi:nicotinate-nucleotide adenylyltransferase